MATATQAARGWARGRANRRAVERFAAFWTSLQRVGNALAEAERLARNAEDASSWRERNTRHWSIASADEVRSALRTCRGSLRILSRSAKRFEPELIHREWKRWPAMANQVDRIVEELDAAMRELRDAMRGILIRRGSFRKTHDNLARDVAVVTTMLDAARPILRKTG